MLETGDGLTEMVSVDRWRDMMRREARRRRLAHGAGLIPGEHVFEQGESVYLQFTYCLIQFGHHVT